MGSASGSYLWTAIAYGRPNTAMAAFQESLGGPLSYLDQRALMNWLIDESGVERAPVPDAPISGDATQGVEVYTKHCAQCHGDNGEGGTGTALANPVFLATATDAFIHHTVVNGRDGTPMRGFKGTLSDTEINHVVAFLRSRATGWTESIPALAAPPEPTNAVLNPLASPAQLVERAQRFVSANSVAAAMERGWRLRIQPAGYPYQCLGVRVRLEILRGQDKEELGQDIRER